MPSGLRSVVLYGSAAAGDHIAGRSDYNVLVVADRLGVAELDAISRPASAWARAGNRPPLLFTREELAASADSFPIELLDMQQSRRVLFGEDPLADVTVRPECLRLELERDLKAKLLQVRERYVLTRGRPAAVAALMASSASSFLALCRAALRLYAGDAPARKLDAATALAQRIGFDPDVFTLVHEMKEGRRKPREAAARFGEYLNVIEQIVDAVDRRFRDSSSGETR